MRYLLVSIYILCLSFIVAHAICASEKFSSLPVRDYFTVYEMSTNMAGLEFGQEVTLTKVVETMACKKYIAIVGKLNKEPGVLIVGKCDDGFKVVFLIPNQEYERNI